LKKVAILGSTGSIGTQTLEVISDNKNIFEVELLTAFSNHTLLINQALLHKPKAIIFGDRSKEKVILNSLKNEEIEIYFGEESLNNFLNYCNPALHSQSS
jgi:1-deoxy-D-xylulose-5-phosphate reductoisomerase